MVSGGIEAGEKAWQTALREIYEETGVVVDRLYSADIIENFYEASRDAVVSVPVFAAYVNERSSVRLSPHEHDAHEWCSLDTAYERLVFSEQKRVLQHIHANFTLKQPNDFLLLYKQ
jgi:dATP pyrophosphohydrolase